MPTSPPTLHIHLAKLVDVAWRHIGFCVPVCNTVFDTSQFNPYVAHVVTEAI